METKTCAPRAAGTVEAGEERKIIYGTDNPNYCYKILPIEEFSVGLARERARSTPKAVRWPQRNRQYNSCKSCRRKYHQRRYDENPELREQNNALTREASRKNRAELRSKISEIKANTPCVDCGSTFHPVAMDFDHVRGTKKFIIGEAVARLGGSASAWDKIQKEIDKCDIRCAICHRIKTYEEHLQRDATNNPAHRWGNL